MAPSSSDRASPYAQNRETRSLINIPNISMMLIWRRRPFGLSRESFLKMLRPMALSGDRGRGFGRRRLQRRTARRSNLKPKSARSWSLQRRWSSQRPPGVVREYRVQEHKTKPGKGRQHLAVCPLERRRIHISGFAILADERGATEPIGGSRLEMGAKCNAIIASPDAIYSESRHDVASPDRDG